MVTCFGSTVRTDSTTPARILQIRDSVGSADVSLIMDMMIGSSDFVNCNVSKDVKLRVVFPTVQSLSKTAAEANR